MHGVAKTCTPIAPNFVPNLELPVLKKTHPPPMAANV